jgi:hypothetical protein
MTASWDVVLCSFGEGNRRFRGAYCINRYNDIIETTRH